MIDSNKNREYCRKYRKEHREQLNLKRRQRYREQRESALEYQRRYYQLHREILNQKQIRYREKRRLEREGMLNDGQGTHTD